MAHFRCDSSAELIQPIGDIASHAWDQTEHLTEFQFQPILLFDADAQEQPGPGEKTDENRNGLPAELPSARPQRFLRSSPSQRNQLGSRRTATDAGTHTPRKPS